MCVYIHYVRHVLTHLVLIVTNYTKYVTTTYQCVLFKLTEQGCVIQLFGHRKFNIRCIFQILYAKSAWWYILTPNISFVLHAKLSINS